MSARTQATARLAPVQAGDRIQAVDVLRGFALFGILLVNFEGTGGARVADEVARWFVNLLVRFKFYPLFSFLFGLGFGIQLLRARSRGAPVVPVYVRRMLVLAVIGVAHFILLWNGDILRHYALLGLVLILFRNFSPRALLLCVLAAFAISAYVPGSLANPPELSRPDPEVGFTVGLERAAAAEPVAEARTYTTWATAEGTYPELVTARAQLLWRNLPSFLLDENTDGFGYLAGILAMFLLGLYAAKRRLFEDLEGRRAFAIWTLGIGLGVGLVLQVVIWGGRFGFEWIPELPGWLSSIVRRFGGPTLTIGYIAGIVLLVQRARAGRILSVLAPVGRMALTNYLLQSVIGTTLFYGYAFGLYGKVRPALGVGLGVLIFSVQILFSHWWMARFRFGPAEWLWRTLTYMRLQPMRRERKTSLIEPALAPAGPANFPSSP